ncbi:MAG: carbohydrate deacetylase [Chloroflexi bacterium]|nr:carbohydrate deacetylase [Chloroflexota bacterium]
MGVLIVNADDFGISDGVNMGIVEAHRRGILTSTTVMANMPAFDHAMRLARDNPELGVGIHLNITSGTPLLPSSQVPCLARPDGRFHSPLFVLRQLTLGQLDGRQIEAELSAQVERAMSAGISPTHLDSHHHVHMHPRLQPIAIRIARRFGIRALRSTTELGPGDVLSRTGVLSGRAFSPRFSKTVVLTLLGAMLSRRAQRAGLLVPEHFRGLLLGLAFSSEDLLRLLQRLPAGATELMCHPGYPDETLRRQTSYANGRDLELAALLAPASRSILQQDRVRLSSFAALPARR